MSHLNDGKRTRYQELFRNATALIAGLLIILNGTAKVQEFVSQYQAGKLQVSETLPPLLLFALTVLYGLAWYVATTREYGLLDKYYLDVAPERPTSAILASVAVPAVLVLLAYFADQIGTYAAIFCAYVLINMIVRSAMTGTVQRILTEAQDVVSDAINNEFRLLYLGRPYQVLNAFLLLAGVASLLLRYTFNDHVVIFGSEIDNRLAAYLVIGGALFFSELLIWFWRSRLYRAVP